MRKLKQLLLLLLIVGVSYLAIDSFYLSLRVLNVEVVELKDKRIPTSFNDRKIMIISDVYSDTTNLGKLKHQADVFNPDLVIFLGNLLNEDGEVATELEAVFKSIKAPLGKYAILSLDDYAANESVRKFLFDTDFRIIDTDLVPIHAYTEETIDIAFYGAVDNNNGRSAINDASNPNTFTLGLIHDPGSINGLESKNIDVWVAGKTNHGKINFPILGSLAYKELPTQKMQLINTIPLYLTSGIGTDSPRVRFGSKPDIIILKLKSS